MAREPEQSAAPTQAERHARSSRSGRFAAAVAAVAAVALVGCGSGSAEPKEKDWDEGDTKQSQQQSGGDGQGDQKSDDQEKSDKGDEDNVVRKGDKNNPDADTKKQAEQLIADYLDAQNAATKDGDFSRVAPMVEECQICSTSKSNITEVYDRGGKVEGSLFTKPKVTAGQERNGKVSVTVVSTISAYTVTDKSGEEVDSGSAEEQTYQYSVAKQEGEWKIVSGRFVE